MFRTPATTPPILAVAFGNKVFGIDMPSGKRLLRTEVQYATVLRLLVHGDALLVLGTDLSCLDLATGRVLWKAGLAGAVTSGTLVAHGEFVFAGDAGEVSAFDRSTGRLLWHGGFKGEGLGGVALATPSGSAQHDRSG